MNKISYAVVPICIFGWIQLGLSVFAQPTDSAIPTTRARSAPVFTVYFENDAFTGTDQHYTNGMKFSWLSADLANWGESGWPNFFIHALPFVNRSDGQKNFGVALGQNIYTPYNIETTTPDPTDRPYAGWLYLEIAFVSKTPSVCDTVSIQAGVVGPASQAEESQREVHRLIGSARPRGWDHQLKNEAGINIIYERRWRLYERALFQTVGFDLIPHTGVSLGNVQTYANAGGTIRFGINLPSDFGVQLARAGSVGGGPTDDLDPRVALRRNFSIFVFGAADGRAIARDIFLDGNTFRDSPSVAKKHWVADLSVGVGLIAGAWQFTFTQARRTREFETQTESYNDFGSATVSRAF
jgi:hypothetical protein